MPSFQAAGSIANLLLSVSPHPSLCPPLSIRLSPRHSCDPSINSISPWWAVLFRLIASPDPFLPHHPIFLSVPLSLCCSCSISHFPARRPPPPTPPCYLSLTPSVLFHHSLLHSPVLLRVIMHQAISYQFVTFCFLLGIHNPLRISLSSLCAAFCLLYMKQLCVVCLSSMLMPECMLATACP